MPEPDLDRLVLAGIVRILVEDPNIKEVRSRIAQHAYMVTRADGHDHDECSAVRATVNDYVKELRGGE